MTGPPDSTSDLQRQLRECQALLAATHSEIEALAYSVSHDLRAPLRAIEGFARILLDDFSATLEPEARRYLNFIASGGEQMNRMMDDLLAYSRLNRAELSLENVDMVELLQSVIAGRRAKYSDRPTTVDIGPLPSCWADRELVHRALIHLLDNAFKFSRQETALKIEIGSIPDEHASVYFVRDNGIGFDMKYADKIFGLFQKLHRAEQFGGNGAGLALAQRILNRLGGRIWADAKVSEGATFYFSLPSAKERAKSVE